MSNFLQIIESWTELWGASLWRASWQGAIVLALSWAIARWCTGLSPRIVCWIWRLACLKLLVALLWIQPVGIPVLSGEPVREAALKSDSHPIPAAEVVLEEAPAGEPTQLISQADPPQRILTMTSLLLPLWLAGVCYAILSTAWEWSFASRLCRSAEPVSNGWLQQACHQEADRLGVRRLPQLRLSPETEGPLLAGIWRPTIVLPESAEAMFDESELRLMLGHELGHLKRRDLLWNWLPTVVRWLLFFHPLVWLMTRRWSEAQEAACDELLIQKQVAQPAIYARLLLKLSTQWPLEPRTALATAGVLGVYRNLERRILAMTHVRRFSSRRLAIAAGVLALIALPAIIPWQLVAQETLQSAAAPAEVTPVTQTQAGSATTNEEADTATDQKAALDPECRALIDANVRTLDLIRSIEVDYTIVWIEKPQEPVIETWWSREGRRERSRSDGTYFDSRTKELRRVLNDRVVDGDTCKWLQNWDPQHPPKIRPLRPGTVRATVGPQTNVSDPGAPSGFLLLDVTSFPRRSLSELAKVSPKVECKGKVQLDGRDLWLLSLESPEETTPTTTKHYYDVYLDPAAGHMIRKVVVNSPKVILDDGKTIKNSHAHEVVEFKDFGGGIFVPMKIRNGSLDSYLTELVVKSVNINEPIPPATFEMHWPKYVQVVYHPPVDGRFKVVVWGDGKPLREITGPSDLQALEAELRQDPKIAAELDAD